MDTQSDWPLKQFFLPFQGLHSQSSENCTVRKKYIVFEFSSQKLRLEFEGVILVIFGSNIQIFFVC